MVVPLLKSLRPKHWIKNLIISGPLVFSLHLFDLAAVIRVLCAIGLFCAVASAIYLVNDIADIEKDRAHPEKRHRPLPSGQLPIWVAILAAACLGGAGIITAWFVDRTFAASVSVYFVLNLLYSFLFKRMVILDVMVLASGFVIRVLAGAAIISVPASEWLVMCTILLALFLGFAKRRHELSLLNNKAESHRQVLEHYSPYLLDQLIMIVTSATVLSYALYTVAPSTVAQFGTNKLIYTVPFVMYGIFRYLYLIHQKQEGGNPTRVFFTDTPIIVTVFLWVLTSAVIIYHLKLGKLLSL